MTLALNWRPRFRNQVIAESYSDGAFITAVGRAHNVPDFDFSTPLGKDGRPLGKDGFGQLILAMRPFIDRDQMSRIVIVGDNDTDHAGNFNSIRRAIRDAGGYPTPAVTPLSFAAKDDLRVGVVMLPATGESGCLETLLLKATMTHGISEACLDGWMKCSGFPVLPKNNYDKFQIRSILSAIIKDEPNITIQRIWEKAANPIKADDPAFKWIADFLKTVFS